MSESNKKQAVLLIHGIGEQKPMESLKGFVRAVWSTDSSLHGSAPGSNGLWSKPHVGTHSYDLRRLTTAPNKSGLSTDFYELYWAHLMRGNTINQVITWLKVLLFRSPYSVPKALKTSYWTLIGLIAIWISASVYMLFNQNDAASGVATFLSIPLFVLVLTRVSKSFANIVGDAARYLDSSPENVVKRDEIRRLGVDILKSLHNDDYERIIVVGHSLGSIIGYEVLYHSWVELNSKWDKESTTTLELTKLEELVVQNPDEKLEVDVYQDQQSFVFDELVYRGSPWRVTDFITLGSPLAHAEILMAIDADDLSRGKRQRELAMCPPILEHSFDTPPISRFSYPLNSDARRPHHAALFGPTRWHNIYFPCRGIIKGDIVGGPVSPVFGFGIRDIPVETNIRAGFLSHTLYWTGDSDVDFDLDHIKALRMSLNLSKRI